MAMLSFDCDIYDNENLFHFISNVKVMKVKNESNLPSSFVTIKCGSAMI